MEALKTAQDLIALRKALGFSQSQMAAGIGLGMRAYQEIEAGRSELRQSHAMACELLSLRAALGAANIALALPNIRRDALDFAALVRGEAADL